jgi:YVTN family beta-propeller protein
MEYRILGEVEVRDGDRLLTLHGRRERALLAYLVLHANEIVPTERLIGELWGESPPATVAAALHVYISRLRKVLGENGSAIVTRSPGYVLEVDPEQVDARRFERLVDAGRRALSEGDPRRSAQLLRDALGLWHGTPLADVIEPEWAASEIRRLRELRVAALEDRIEADLQLGRHAQLVSELEGLVPRHPLRERLRAQLMVALYRCGRQGDALQVYADTRRVLAEELGIDPSGSLRRLEQGILAQDPALDAPHSDHQIPARATRRSRRLLLVAGLATAGAIAGVAIAATRGGSPVVVVPDSVAVIDTASNRVVKDISLGGRPSGIAAGAGAVWVADYDDGTVVRIDLETERTRAIALGLEPGSVAVDSNAVWATDGLRLARIDAHFGNVTATKLLRHQGQRFRPKDLTSGSPAALASGPAGLWIGHGISAVSQINPAAVNTARTLSLADVPLALAVADDSVWVVAPPTNRLISIDPATASITGSVRVANMNYGAAGVYVSGGIAVDRSSVWVATGDAVTRIDRLGLGTIRRIHTSTFALGIAIGAGSVWVTNNLAGTVSRIDPKRNRVVATIKVGGNPAWLAVTGDRVWVTVT